MNKIKVSIIVPVYNVERHLEKCLDSLINQTFKEFEVILVDDGSSDSSSKICDEYLKKDERIVVIHKKNEGVSVARNIGINTAKGKYILFCDSDDYVEKDWCETLYKLQIDNSKYFNMCGYFNINYREKMNKYIKRIIENNKELSIINAGDFYLLYENQVFNPLWNKIYELDIIKKNRIQFEKNLSLGEDLIFNLEYLRASQRNICFINKCKYNYILRNEESLDNKYYSDLYDIYVMLYRKIYDTMSFFKIDFEKYRYNYYKSYFFMLKRVLKNTFSEKSNMNIFEKIKYNSYVIKSEDFKICLNNIDYNVISNRYKWLYQKGNYFLIWVYEYLGKKKYLNTRGRKYESKKFNL